MTNQIWFKHDLKARNDKKLLKVNRLYGLEGIGIYWCLVEMLYENKGKLENEDLKIFSDFYKVDMEKVIGVCNLCFLSFGNKYVSDRVTDNLYKGKKVSEPDWMEEKPQNKEGDSKRAKELIEKLFGEKDKKEK